MAVPTAISVPPATAMPLTPRDGPVAPAMAGEADGASACPPRPAPGTGAWPSARAGGSPRRDHGPAGRHRDAGQRLRGAAEAGDAPPRRAVRAHVRHPGAAGQRPAATNPWSLPPTAVILEVGVLRRGDRGRPASRRSRRATRRRPRRSGRSCCCRAGPPRTPEPWRPCRRSGWPRRRRGQVRAGPARARRCRCATARVRRARPRAGASLAGLRRDDRARRRSPWLPRAATPAEPRARGRRERAGQAWRREPPPVQPVRGRPGDRAAQAGCPPGTFVAHGQEAAGRSAPAPAPGRWPAAGDPGAGRQRPGLAVRAGPGRSGAERQPAGPAACATRLPAHQQRDIGRRWRRLARPADRWRAASCCPPSAETKNWARGIHWPVCDPTATTVEPDAGHRADRLEDAAAACCAGVVVKSRCPPAWRAGTAARCAAGVALAAETSIPHDRRRPGPRRWRPATPAADVPAPPGGGDVRAAGSAGRRAGGLAAPGGRPGGRHRAARRAGPGAERGAGDLAATGRSRR